MYCGIMAMKYLERALKLAAEVDAVVMAVGTSGKYETEASDRDAKLNMSIASHSQRRRST